jgi:hypothetical protein
MTFGLLLLGLIVLNLLIGVFFADRRVGLHHTPVA